MKRDPQTRLVPSWALVCFLCAEALLGAAWWRSYFFVDSVFFLDSPHAVGAFGHRIGVFKMGFGRSKAGSFESSSDPVQMKPITPDMRDAHEPELLISPVSVTFPKSASVEWYVFQISHWLAMLLTALAFALYVGVRRRRIRKDQRILDEGGGVEAEGDVP
ncbi:MAG: hypothetical protein R3F11_25610 [Verrucomicrobiales bacterium]